MKPRVWVAAFLLLLASARFVAADRLDLFGDEVFYFLCSQHLALAYADHPFMTALWVRGGVELLGPTPLGVRLLFLLSGLLFPFAMQRLARPVVGSGDAWLVAGAAGVVPVLAYQGVVAVPDVPLLLFAVLALHGFERAVATDGSGWWLLAGLASALGLATHLRFVLVPLSFLVYALVTPSGRGAWRSRCAWLASGVALSGALPLLLHNQEVGFAPLRFQLLDRHGDASGVVALGDFVASQLLAAGPLMFPAMVAILLVGLRRFRTASAARALLLVFAATHLGVFLFAAPFADARHVSLHWPAPAYVALLVLLPEALRRFHDAAPSAWRRIVVALVPGLGAILLLGALVELATGMVGVESFRGVFATGHREVAAAVARQLADGSEARPRLLVADRYALGGRLALYLGPDVEVYFLRHPHDVRQGRHRQLERWGLGEEGLGSRAGEAALLVLEKDGRDFKRFRTHALSLLTEPRRAGKVQVDLPDGPRVFQLYRGRVARDQSERS